MKNNTVTLHGRVFKPQKGLDGPFQYPNGRVLYFDPSVELYYDPTTDFYVSDAEVNFLKGLLLTLVSRDSNEPR